jgi:PAS domain S-box-containing protein
MYVWGKNSDSIREKKQSLIICISSIVPFVINLIVQTLLPMVGIKSLPPLGQVFTLIMVLGIFYVIKKYRFFSVSTESLVDEILSNMMDLFILLSPKGKILRVSKSTEELLKYENGEIIGRDIDSVINEKVFLENIYSRQNDISVIKYEKLNCMAKDGSPVAISGTCSFIIDKYLKDVLGIAIVGHDIILMQELEKEIEEHKQTEKMLKESQERFVHLAYHDSLTDLPNRKYFYERLFIELKKANRNNSKFAVFFLDLDGFKNVNDNYGHEMGDYLLCEVANRIKGSW